MRISHNSMHSFNGIQNHNRFGGGLPPSEKERLQALKQQLQTLGTKTSKEEPKRNIDAAHREALRINAEIDAGKVSGSSNTDGRA